MEPMIYDTNGYLIGRRGEPTMAQLDMMNMSADLEDVERYTPLADGWIWTPNKKSQKEPHAK